MVIKQQIPRQKFSAEVEAVTPTAIGKGIKEPTRRRARPSWAGVRK